MILGDMRQSISVVEIVQAKLAEIRLKLSATPVSNGIPNYLEANEDNLETLFWLDHETNDLVKRVFDEVCRLEVTVTALAGAGIEAEQRGESYVKGKING